MALETVHIIHHWGSAYKIEQGCLLSTALLSNPHNNIMFSNDEEDWSEIAWGQIDEDDERELLTYFIPLGLDMETVGGCPTHRDTEV